VKLFDFLFHKSGPMEGQPRGYCFVNFHTKEEAGRVIHCLNGKLALSKKLVVHWAHAQVKSLSPSLLLSHPLTLSFPLSPIQSRSATICAMEAKLQMMEENPDGEEIPGPLSLH
ncbi:unnamed protein product, partial [Coregonus sp. 'balchen']